jgi:molybdenum cofactor guanylyltransferase
MDCAGFVLVGGKSSRMGRNKALLPWKGRTLLEHVVSAVSTVARNVSLVGDDAEYTNFGYPVIPDLFPHCGPLSGIHAALRAAQAEWNLIVACDMPEITADFLDMLMTRAGQTDADAVLPSGPSGMIEPLCAAYRLRAAAAIENALERNIRKVTDGLADLRIDVWRVPDSRHFHNLNTPAEWAEYSNA